MRTLSFILALFLAAVSFVAAAPQSSSSTVGTISVQDITNAIQNATTHLSPIGSSLTSALKQSSPDVTSATEYFGQFTAVIQTTTSQLQNMASVDLSNADLSDLCGAINALLCLVVSLLEVVLALVTGLTPDVLCTLVAVICDLLNAITALLDCLAPFIVGSLATLLGAIISLVVNLVACVLALVSAV